MHIAKPKWKRKRQQMARLASLAALDRDEAAYRAERRRQKTLRHAERVERKRVETLEKTDPSLARQAELRRQHDVDQAQERRAREVLARLHRP